MHVGTCLFLYSSSCWFIDYVPADVEHDSRLCTSDILDIEYEISFTMCILKPMLEELFGFTCCPPEDITYTHACRFPILQRLLIHWLPVRTYMFRTTPDYMLATAWTSSTKAVSPCGFWNLHWMNSLASHADLRRILCTSVQTCLFLYSSCCWFIDYQLMLNATPDCVLATFWMSSMNAVSPSMYVRTFLNLCCLLDELFGFLCGHQEESYSRTCQATDQISRLGFLCLTKNTTVTNMLRT